MACSAAPQAAVRSVAEPEYPLRPATPRSRRSALAVLAAAAVLPLLAQSSPYRSILGIDVLIAVIFATSLHFIMGPGGMHSFGHAAYFGLGAYGAALLVKWLAVPMGVALVAAPLVALAGALLFGWFAVRLSGVYLAMLTLAFAQIVWVDRVPVGGAHRRLQRRARHLADRAVRPGLRSITCSRWCWSLAGVLLLRRMLFAPFGYAMRAGRDSPLRAEAIGIDVKRVHWLGFAIAGAVCGVAGGLFAFAKGSISPETISVGRSIDGLVMVLLGGIQTLIGPIVGASVFAVLQDTVMRQTEYWRALLGAIILVLVLAFPRALSARFAQSLAARGRSRHERARGPRAVKVLRRRARRRRRELRVARGRIPGPDRSQRRRQIDLLQHDQRPACAGQRRRSASTAATSPGCRRARSGGSASAAPSRSPRLSAR